MHTVILTELGIIIYDGERLKDTLPFRDASEYVAVKKGEGGISGLWEHLAGANTAVTVNDAMLHAVLKRKSVDVQMMNEEESDRIQSQKPQVLIESGLAKDQDDARAKLREFAMQLSSSKVTEASESPDLHIIQAIGALDDVDRMANALGSRLREWYGLHFPELENIVDSIVGYSQIVGAGKRDGLSAKVFEDAGFPESKVEMLSLILEKSRGGDITSENMEIVQMLAGQILDMHELRKKIELQVETQMRAIAPNISAILGTAVGARILARAGSLKRLSSMPASTIQVLGAEKALFRSLKTGARPPKHGLLFQHALVHAAPRWQRGKIARTIAAKAAIASRVDVYDGTLNKTLLDKLNIRVDEIDKKYKEPPPPKPREEYDSSKGREKFKKRDYKRDERPRGDYDRSGGRDKFKKRDYKRDERPQGDRDRSGGRDEFKKRDYQRGERPQGDRDRSGGREEFKKRDYKRPQDRDRSGGRDKFKKREYKKNDRGAKKKRKKFGR